MSLNWRNNRNFDYLLSTSLVILGTSKVVLVDFIEISIKSTRNIKYQLTHQ